MKILYELVITEETGFTATDFPEHFEILRKDKPPLVFKPVAIDLQTIYGRLNETEELLKTIRIKTTGEILDDTTIPNTNVRKSIDEYFDRHAQ